VLYSLSTTDQALRREARPSVRVTLIFGKGRDDPGERYLLARNDAAESHKDGLLLHHLGPAYGGNCWERQANHLIDASLTADSNGA